jgi:hypothetical protein
VAAYEPDVDYPSHIVDFFDQSVAVATDIEDCSPVLENARGAVFRLDVRGFLPEAPFTLTYQSSSAEPTTA